MSPRDDLPRIMVRLDTSGWHTAMALAVAAMARFGGVLDDIGHSLNARYFPRNHRLCARCHPIARPKPLAIDGHAYRRRQRNRRRRRG